MSLPPEYRVTETEGILRIEWDRGAIEKAGCVVVFLSSFWIVWAPTTLWVTWQLFDTAFNYDTRDDACFKVCFFPVWLIFGWVGTLSIPYHLVSRRWVESVTVTRDTLTHARAGRFAPGVCVYPLDQVDTIAFGWDRDGPERHPAEEADTPAIYVIQKTGARSWGIAEWTQADHKHELFLLIQRFLGSHDVPVQTVVWGTRNPWVKW